MGVLLKMILSGNVLSVGLNLVHFVRYSGCMVFVSLLRRHLVLPEEESISAVRIMKSGPMGKRFWQSVQSIWN